MNTFNKKTLCAALAGLGALGLAGAAQAVSLNPDGLGQVLIYPYYTVRANADGNAYNSMLSVVNSTATGKAIKVRFLEGKASHEVLDFNLYMSPYDVWTATVFPTADGAAINTYDTTCSFYNVRSSGAAGVAFRNYLFLGSAADGESSLLERTREGYVELIEMADIKAGSSTAKAITHVQGTNGTWAPPNCSYVQDDQTQVPAWAASDLTTGTGGLFGSMTLINVNNARSVGFNAVALHGFFDPTTVAGDLPGAPSNRQPGTLWFPSSSMNPNLSMAWPANSIVVTNKAAYSSTNWAGTSYNPAVAGGWVHSTTDNRDVYTPGLDAVSAALMRSTIYNEYMTDNFVSGATDWVVTMPTKGLSFDRDPGNAGAAKPQLNPRTLFQRSFSTTGSCDDIALAVYGREEEKAASGGISPMPPGITSALCWEANVVNIKGPSSTGRDVLGAKNLNTITSSYDSGWLSLAFAPVTAAITPITGTAYSYTAHQLVNPTTTMTVLATGTTTPGNITTYTGLPMIGFATEVFNNGKVNNSTYGNVWASYANAYEHRYKRDITP